MTNVSTAMSEMSVSEAAVCVTQADDAPTLASVLNGFRTLTGLGEQEEAVRVARDSAFIASAIRVYVLTSTTTTTALDIAKAAKADKLGDMWSASDIVGAHARVGEAFHALPGDLPASVRPSDVQALYTRQARINGKSVRVGLQPKQHNAIMARATDLSDFYRKALAQVRANVTARKGPQTVDVGGTLAKIKESLSLIMAADGWDADDAATFGAIAEMIAGFVVPVAVEG